MKTRTEAPIALPIVFALAALAAGCTVGGGESRDAGPSPGFDAAACEIVCEGRTAVACGGMRTSCDALCHPGLGCVSCSPGRRFCGPEGEVRECAADGSGSAEVERCTDDRVCDTGVCSDLCSEIGEDQPSAGCDFAAVPTLNSLLGGQEKSFMAGLTLGADGFRFAIAIANPNEGAARVHVTGAGADVTRTIAPGALEVVDLPFHPALVQYFDEDLPTNGSFAAYRPTPSLLEPNAAFRVESNAPVIAYQFNPVNFRDEAASHATLCDGGNERCFSFTNDASMLLPVHGLGRSYTVVAMGTQYALETCPTEELPAVVYDNPSGFVAVVAVEDDTTVTVHPRVRLRGGPGVGDPVPAGGTLERTLARGDVLQVVADAPTTEECDPVTTGLCAAPCRETGDLTGSRIVSDRPVAVFAGHDCAQVPYGKVACDHLEDQLWPDESLGREYVVVPMYSQSGATLTPTFGRIVATRDGTEVELDPPAAGVSRVMLDRGEAAEIEVFSGIAVRASEPVAVVQYLVADELTELASDPSMVAAVPKEQWRTEYPLLVPETYEHSWIAVAAERGAVVTLDGERALTPSESGDTYDVYYAPIDPGTHRLNASSPFTVLVSGHGTTVSYAYPGGGNIRFINLI